MLIRDRWQQRTWEIAVAVLIGLFTATSSQAIYLDQNQNISVRARVYSQATIRTEDSRSTGSAISQTVPRTRSGQLIQNRNFYNPELEAKLVSYTTWMKEIPALSWLAPDSFDFRLAAWGFYDGIFDYGAAQFNTARQFPRIVPNGGTKPYVISADGNNILQGNEMCANPQGCVSRAFYARGDNLPSAHDLTTRLGNGEPLDHIFDKVDARDAFAQQNRVNELYLSYAKGPFFLRVGKQSISWGESDTVALLDANNPFDVTLAIPGLFQDIDETRIPLWTVRSTYQLFNTLGPFSSGFIEGYWVPGDIDTTVAEAPYPLGVSPFSPGGIDPHAQLIAQLHGMGLPLSVANNVGDTYDLVLLDRIPKKRFSNSRYGVRLQAVVARSHTVSAWYYTTFNNAPVAVLDYPRLSYMTSAGPRLLGVNETTRKIEHVFGLADTFYFQPLDSILRLEAEYFLREPGVLQAKPGQPASIVPNVPTDGRAGRLNYADHLRFEVGMDRFFFYRPLNPTNSFTWVSAFVGDWNIDETKNKDFGYGPGLDTKAFDNSFVQSTLRTDYMHGKLSPGLTAIINPWQGVFAAQALVDYRFRDWLIGEMAYTVIDGAYHQIGFNRDRDELWFRMTYQLN